MKRVIAYDLGTGGIKASLVNEEGKIEKNAFVPYNTYFPHNEWQEQRPDEWWEAVICSTRLLTENESPAIIQSISAIAISGHSLGVVPIGKDGTLLRDKTPIWSDQRAVCQTAHFFGKTDYNKWYMKTGNGFPPACYPVFKIMWYKENEPEMYAAIDKVIGTKDYCNYRFTGRLVTDYSYASGCGVYNLSEWKYDEELIGVSGLRRDIFPEIAASDEVIGTLTEAAARETGLPAGIQVMCGGVDNSCMALGAKGTASGRVYTSLGSSAWIALVAECPVLDPIHKPYVFAHLIPGMYASATCIFSAGSSYQWVRNTLCSDLMENERNTGESSYEAMNHLAADSVPGANGVLFNPSLAGGSMLEPTPNMSGAFTGLRLRHTRSDLIRATLEGITLNLRIALDVLKSYYPDITEMLIVGGGAKSPFWMQLFADIYGIPVEKTNIDQNAATLGAAALALKGTGIWDNYNRIDQIHQSEARYNLSPEHLLYEEEVLPAFQKLTHTIASINS